MRHVPSPQSPKVTQAVREFFQSPTYGYQKVLCLTYGIPRSTLSQAINRARK